MLHDEITEPWPFGDDADRDDPLTAHPGVFGQGGPR